MNGGASPSPQVAPLQASVLGSRGVFSGGLTLMGCLRRYVRPENIAKWHCEK
jgi:hypothetical protein